MNCFIFTLIFAAKLITCFEKDISSSIEMHDSVPHIVTGNVNVTTFVGETVKLPCEITNLGSHHVNWLKIQNGIPITLTVGYQQFSRNLRYRVARTHDPNRKTKVESWNFEIRRVTPEDQGVFECYIKLNSKHKIKANVYLEVLSKKDQNIPIALYSNNILFDQKNDKPRSERLSSDSIEKIDTPPNSWVKLRCNATLVSSKRNSYDIHWFKDDKLIEQDSRRLKKWVSSYDDSNYMELDVYAVDPVDSGVYQCRRDKTVLKNVILQVLNNNGSRTIFSYQVMMLSLAHLMLSLSLTKIF